MLLRVAWRVSPNRRANHLLHEAIHADMTLLPRQSIRVGEPTTPYACGSLVVARRRHLWTCDVCFRSKDAMTPSTLHEKNAGVEVVRYRAPARPSGPRPHHGNWGQGDLVGLALALKQTYVPRRSQSVYP